MDTRQPSASASPGPRQAGRWTASREPSLRADPGSVTPQGPVFHLWDGVPWFALLAVWAKCAEHRGPLWDRCVLVLEALCPAPAWLAAAGQATSTLLPRPGRAPSALLRGISLSRERVPGTSDGQHFLTPQASRVWGGLAARGVPWAAPGTGLRTAVFQPSTPEGLAFPKPLPVALTPKASLASAGFPGEMGCAPILPGSVLHLRQLGHVAEGTLGTGPVTWGPVCGIGGRMLPRSGPDTGPQPRMRVWGCPVWGGAGSGRHAGGWSACVGACLPAARGPAHALGLRTESRQPAPAPAFAGSEPPAVPAPDHSCSCLARSQRGCGSGRRLCSFWS